MLFCMSTSSPWFKNHLKGLIGTLEAITSSMLMTVVELMHIIHIQSSGLHLLPSTGSICFLTFENTHISKVLVQQLDVSVQHFKGKQLIVVVVQTSTEIQTGIPAVSKRINTQKTRI